MLQITRLLLLFVLIVPLSLHAQEFLNPLTPREPGEDIVKLIQNVKEAFSSKSKLAKLSENNSAEFKKLFALRVFAQLNNPSELYELRMNTEMVESEGIRTSTSAIMDVFQDKERYLALKFGHMRYYLYDLFLGPFAFIGTITKVDTMCYGSFGAIAIKYEMSDLVNMNGHYKADLSAKRMDFVFSTFHRGRKVPEWFINPDASSDETFEGLNHVVSFLPSVHELRIGDRYLVFITPKPNRSSCLKEMNYNHLPFLHLTAMGNEGFPVEDDYIIDVNRYFGQAERISVMDVKKKIDAVMDEIASWRD